MNFKNKKILISTSTFAQHDRAPLQKLARLGFEVVLNPYGRRLTAKDLEILGADASAIIAGTERLDDDVFKIMPKLQVISRCGAGLDTIDLEAAKRRTIRVVNTPEAPVQSVAELTLGLMLGTIRRASEADRSLRAGTWKPLMGRLLAGKTIGLIGLGRIGREMVRLLQPFQPRFLACERRPQKLFVKQHHIQLVRLPTLLRKADLVSLHITLDDQTRGLIGAKELAIMKPDAILINTSRGELVDDTALAAALQSGKLQGAGLDVFATEPYRGPLIQCPTAFLTCHMGSYAVEARIAMEREAVDNLLSSYPL